MNINQEKAKRAGKRFEYYEGVFQLRQISNEILKTIIEKINKSKHWISKSTTHRNGIDLQVSSKKFISNLARELIKKYGGTLKQSPKLFSKNRQTSKEVYRLAVLYKAPRFKPGDVIKHHEDIIKIKYYNKDKIIGTDIIKNKKIIIKEEETMHKIKPIFSKVVSVKPQIFAQDPETFETKILHNAKGLKKGQTIEIIKYNDKLYYLRNTNEKKNS